MKKKLLALTLSSLVCATGASAQSLVTTYVEGNLAIYPGVSGETPLGIDLRGAIELNEMTGVDNLFAFAGYRYLTDKTDYSNLYFGAGYNHSVDSQTRIWGGANLEYQKVEYDETYCFHPGVCSSRSGSFNDTSIALRGGLRHQHSHELEFGGELRLVTGDFDYLGIKGFTRFFFEEDLYAIGEVDIQDGDLGLVIGLGKVF